MIHLVGWNLLYYVLMSRYNGTIALFGVSYRSTRQMYLKIGHDAILRRQLRHVQTIRGRHDNPCTIFEIHLIYDGSNMEDLGGCSRHKGSLPIKPQKKTGKGKRQEKNKGKLCYFGFRTHFHKAFKKIFLHLTIVSLHRFIIQRFS